MRQHANSTEHRVYERGADPWHRSLNAPPITIATAFTDAIISGITAAIGGQAITANDGATNASTAIALEQLAPTLQSLLSTIQMMQPPKNELNQQINKYKINSANEVPGVRIIW